MTRQQKTVSRILEIKGVATEQREAEVKKAGERLAAAESRQAELEHEYKRSSNDFTSKQSAGSVPVAQMELFYCYLKHLGKEIDRQKKLVSLCAAEHETARQAMLEAFKEQRVLEKLHDKLDEARRREADQVEQKEADYQYLIRKDK